MAVIANVPLVVLQPLSLILTVAASEVSGDFNSILAVRSHPLLSLTVS